MWTKRLARDIGSLCRVDAGSPEQALYRVATATARGVPGCSGATVAIWHAGEPVDYATSHAELAALLEVQCGHDGPAVEAIRKHRTIFIDDALADERWPRYRGAALRCGVRSSLFFPFKLNGDAMTFGLYGVRPHAFHLVTAGPITTMLAEQVSVALHNAGRYTHVAMQAADMRKALSSRPLIDQAKGIIMHARGCDADTAFEELRRVSQRTHTKVSVVARKLVQENAAANHTPPSRPHPGERQNA